MLFFTQKTHSAAGCTELICSLRGKVHIYTVYSLVSKHNAEWDKWQQDLGRFVVPSISLCSWVKAHHKWSEEKEKWLLMEIRSARNQVLAVPTKLSGSDLHIPFGKGFDYFSLYLADKAQQPHWTAFLHQHCKNICSAASSLVFELHCTPFVLLCCM